MPKKPHGAEAGGGPARPNGHESVAKFCQSCRPLLTTLDAKSVLRNGSRNLILRGGGRACSQECCGQARGRKRDDKHRVQAAGGCAGGGSLRSSRGSSHAAQGGLHAGKKSLSAIFMQARRFTFSSSGGQGKADRASRGSLPHALLMLGRTPSAIQGLEAHRQRLNMKQSKQTPTAQPALELTRAPHTVMTVSLTATHWVGPTVARTA
eukprot:90371-Chlamydomonas_euryale.AAC.1